MQRAIARVYDWMVDQLFLAASIAVKNLLQKLGLQRFKWHTGMEVRIATTLMLVLYIVGLLEWPSTSFARLCVRRAVMTLVVVILALLRAGSELLTH
jgi:hypothetical protein